jgi:hypothetical protein
MIYKKLKISKISKKFNIFIRFQNFHKISKFSKISKISDYIKFQNIHKILKFQKFSKFRKFQKILNFHQTCSHHVHLCWSLLSQKNRGIITWYTDCPWVVLWTSENDIALAPAEFDWKNKNIKRINSCLCKVNLWCCLCLQVINYSWLLLLCSLTFMILFVSPRTPKW